MVSNSLQIFEPNLKEKPHVTEIEAKAIWAEADKSHVRMLIKTLWYTGLRITEAINIETTDVQRNGFDFGILIKREKQTKGKKQEFQKVELLPVSRDFGLDLYDYIKTEGITGRLFPANRSTYWRQIQKCAHKAGLANWKEIHPHSFRHGFIYDKAKKGVHPYVLSKLAGHTQLKTTMGYYQPTENDLRQAMEK